MASKKMIAGDPEIYPPDALVEEEPKYLRRQKPVEIKRRKFGRQQRAAYLRATLVAGMVMAGVAAAGFTVHYLLFGAAFRFEAERLQVAGTSVVPRAAVLERFRGDDGKSVLRISLEERRRALEEIPWVQHARVERMLPNELRVEIVERTPVAFLRTMNDLGLIDAEGVLLERPMQAEYRFPVVTGLSESMPREDRRSRMQLFMTFVADVERVQPGAAAYLSEVDLADRSNLRATVSDLPAQGETLAAANDAVLIHFGEGDFEAKYRVYLENIAQWRASAGRVDSVDLRFDRQVVVNPGGLAAAPSETENVPPTAPGAESAPAPKRGAAGAANGAVPPAGAPVRPAAESKIAKKS